MADKRSGSGAPQEGTPEYRWLYGQDDAATGRGRARGEETRYHPTAQRPTRQRPADPGATRPYEQGGARPYEPWEEHRPDLLPGGPGAPGGPGDGGRRGGGRGRGPRRRSTGRTVFKVVRLALVAWLVFLVAVPFYAYSRINRVEAFGEHQAGWQPGTTYLVVGSDSRGGLTKEEQKRLGTGGDDVGQRTDTIMLLHVGKGPRLLMSIPRDSLVEVPGRGTSKINAAYAWGGAPLLAETIERNTGIRVDHYVEIGFGGLVGMVDAVGGIEICPKKAMKDKQAKLDIPKGCQEADGATALGYARSRKTYKALGDVDRARAQREVVAAIGDEALSPMTFVNPFRYWGLANATADAFTVSDGTGPIDLGRFGLAMTQTGGDKGLTCGVPIRDLAVHWDEKRSKELFKHVIAGDTSGIPEGLCTPSGLPE